MRAFGLVLAMVFVSACGSSGGRPVSLDQGTGSGDGGACKAEGFVCAKASDCCAGLTCTNTVCTNPGGVTDMATKPKDFSMGGGGLVCGGLLNCVNQCADATCIQNCAKMSSQGSVTLLQNLFTCLFGDSQTGKSGACNDWNNGVCDTQSPNYNQTSCDNCLKKAQAQGGACYNTLLLCLADCHVDEDCAGLTCGGGACTCSNGQCG